MLVNSDKLKEAVLEALKEHEKQPRPFNCNYCPRNANASLGPFCPAWGAIMMEENGKTEIYEECYFARMEKWHEGIRGVVNINIESVNAARQEVVNAREHSDVFLTEILMNAAQNFVSLRDQSDPRVVGSEKRLNGGQDG